MARLPRPLRVERQKIGQTIARIRQVCRSLAPHVQRIRQRKDRLMRKIALITGANRGLGRNTALAIAARGGDVIIAHRGAAGQA